jgi:hypothetical protein
MLQAVRLPHVRFEDQVLETKDKEGHIQYKTVTYAYITPAGGKDEVVKVADEWVADLMNKSMTRGPFDSAANEYTKWYERFAEMLKRHRDGQEMTVDGTPLRASMAFTQAEVKQCESVKIFSVEDLACANEEGLMRLGMGGRNLKIKAQKLLESKDGDKLAQENEALRVRLAELEEKVTQMVAAGVQEPKKRGRPAKAT